MKSQCQRLTEWGRCEQNARQEGFCTFHLAWAAKGEEPQDRYHHRKIVRGLYAATEDTFSSAELHAVTEGRRRGDGRRLDAWCLDDPVGT